MVSFAFLLNCIVSHTVFFLLLRDSKHSVPPTKCTMYIQCIYLLCLLTQYGQSGLEVDLFVMMLWPLSPTPRLPPALPIPADLISRNPHVVSLSPSGEKDSCLYFWKPPCLGWERLSDFRTPGKWSLEKIKQNYFLTFCFHCLK